MFLQASLILLTGGVSASVHAGMPPQEQTPPRADTPRADTPPGADTPREQTTPQKEQTPPRANTLPGADTPQSRHPLAQGVDTPPEADSGIRSTSGRHASHWNAFFFDLILH